MGTLLQRKKTVEKALDAQRLSLPVPGRSEIERAAGRPAAPRTDRPPQKPPDPPAKTPDAANTTTSRLLDMKRKRQQEEKP
jgi:hypothetical protein